jgi:hypothetical protein
MKTHHQIILIETKEFIYDAQKVAKVDLLRTEVRLSDLYQNIIKEKNTLAVQKRILFSLMGFVTHRARKTKDFSELVYCRM